MVKRPFLFFADGLHFFACPSELIAFDKRYEEFRSAVQVVGVSFDL